MLVKNSQELFSANLSTEQFKLREIGLKALEIAVNAVKPKNLISKSVEVKKNTILIQSDEYDLSKFNKIYIIGGGKAVAEMAITLEKLLKKYPGVEYSGYINVPKGLHIDSSMISGNIEINHANHPIPDDSGLLGTKSMIKLIEKSTKDDLILCLISGGGSALLPLPREPVSLEDLRDTNSLLLASGAPIHEVNAVRKHLSNFKGGNLAKKVFKAGGAKLISLIISDVISDDLDSIASGPTVPDTTTFYDSMNVLKKYRILEKIPSSAKKVIEDGLIDKNLENPKPYDDCFDNTRNYLIGSVASATGKVIRYLNDQEFETNYFSNQIAGEAKMFGKSLFDLFCQTMKSNKKKKIALIGSGELTVTLRGKGVGGRNQEMLLSFLDNLRELTITRDFLVIGANLDGIEGNSRAMGALVDNFTLLRIKTEKIDVKGFLKNNDSNNFFKQMKCEIITGPTGCNVNDIILILIAEREKM